MRDAFHDDDDDNDDAEGMLYSMPPMLLTLCGFMTFNACVHHSLPIWQIPADILFVFMLMVTFSLFRRMTLEMPFYALANVPLI